MVSLMALRMELVMPPNTTSTLSCVTSLRTRVTASCSLVAVSSRIICSGRPSRPPDALMSSITIFATFALGMPPQLIGPVRSVAMPTLMGSAAQVPLGL